MKLVAQIFRAAVFAVRDTGGSEVDCRIEFYRAEAVERTASPDRLKDDLTDEALHEFDRIHGWVKGDDLRIDIHMKRRPNIDKGEAGVVALVRADAQSDPTRLTAMRDMVRQAIEGGRPKGADKPLVGLQPSGPSPEQAVIDAVSTKRGEKKGFSLRRALIASVLAYVALLALPPLRGMFTFLPGISASSTEWGIPAWDEILWVTPLALGIGFVFEVQTRLVAIPQDFYGVEVTGGPRSWVLNQAGSLTGKAIGALIAAVVGLLVGAYARELFGIEPPNSS